MSEPPRKRAKLACVTCNARRIKCDVTNRQPCGNCLATNSVCETRESKRGKHPNILGRLVLLRSLRGAIACRSSLLVLERQFAVSAPFSPQCHQDEVAASHVLASLSSNFHTPNKKRKATFGEEHRFAIPPLSPAQSDQHKVEPAQIEDDAAVFLGESSSLRYVTEQLSPMTTERRQSFFRHAVPHAVKAEALIPQWEAERRRARVKTLQADGAFSYPPAPIRLDLLKAYFRWFHPHFAIVDEDDFWASHREGNVSHLLLQAMLFIGVIHCEESTLVSLGRGNRHRAKWLFYIRAKDIYDATYETNKLTVIKSLFLMSFWRAGALLEKDVRHWLGTAITLSQTKALHRSGAEAEDKTTRLKRRLWWAIYVRERQCASALGLPNRIRDKDCDIEPLAPADFESAFAASTPVADAHCYTAHVIGMVQLAVLLGRIVDAGYLPNRALRPKDRAKIRDELYKWKRALPKSLQLYSDTGDQPSVQASILHLAYNNLLILLYRASFIADDGRATSDGNIALQAAAINARIVEDMLPGGNIGHAQIHVITNLFNTLCIHVMNLRRSTGINKTLAEHRAKLCLLGLQELQRTWEVTNWVLQLFFQYLDRETASRLTMEADDAGFSSAARQTPSKPALSSSLTQPSPQTTTTESSAPSLNEQLLASTSEIPVMPWSWTMDEANQYLFTQIENNFAFREGGTQQGSSEEAPNNSAVADLGYSNSSG